jgi:hypothetical protein
MKRKKILVITAVFALSLLVTSTLSVFATSHDGKEIIIDDDRPRISIRDVQGGFGVSVTVKNVGAANGEDIPWTISFSNNDDASEGIIIIGDQKSGILDIATGEIQTIETGFVFGIGEATMTVKVGSTTYGPEKVLMLGPLVIGA